MTVPAPIHSHEHPAAADNSSQEVGSGRIALTYQDARASDIRTWRERVYVESEAVGRTIAGHPEAQTLIKILGLSPIAGL